MSALPPVRKSVVVPLDRPAAFDLFVRRLPEWWPLATRSVHLDRAASCHVEAHAGGRLHGGWPGVLARFEARARGEGELPEVTGPGCIPRGGPGGGDSR
jgi:hypothetical protein